MFEYDSSHKKTDSLCLYKYGTYLLQRFLNLRILTCIISVMCLIGIIQLFRYGVYNYEHIPEDKILTQLYRETSKHMVAKSKVECQYEQIINNHDTIESWEVYRTYDDFSPKGIDNGSYVPETCKPAFSVAILVTYRNREKQLDIFLPYMHNFLRKQNIHYKIFLIEQQDDKPWNKGKLYNIGARIAISEKFPCLILHDVDLLPLAAGNLYACATSPRHLSASIDKFRYVLPYRGLVGGVLAIRSDQYILVDGFSNRFEGWGGEDDDFQSRMHAVGLDVVRFPRRMSRYTMVRHSPERPNSARHRILAENARRADAGYRAASARHSQLRPQRLFTLLAVRL